MIGQFPQFLNSPANPNAVIWRYMAYDKFVSMLENQALFFPSAELFEDEFEGSVGEDKRRARDYVLKQFWKPEIAEEQARRLAELGRWNRQFTFISCWHLNESESNAMWKLYATTKKAISITSTFQKLKDAVPGNCEIHEVNYIDYQMESIPDGHSLYPFFYKRKAFQHEKELRAIIQGLDSTAPRTNLLRIPVDLKNVITTVRVAPLSSNQFMQEVQKACDYHGLSKTVERSSMEDAPFF